MRILQVIPFYTPSRGGSVVAPHNLVRALKERGHDMTVLTTDFELDRDFARSIDGVEVVPVPVRLQASMMLYSPAMGRWLEEHVSDYDIVHAQNYRTYQNVLVRKMCLRHDVPYVLQAHGSLPSDLGKGTIKRLYDAAWGRRIVRSASRLIAVSEMEAEQYVRLGADRSRVSVIPNAVERRMTSKARGAFKCALGIDGQMVLFLGRLNGIKGLDMLLRAFSRCRSKTSAVLVIAGPDEDGCRSELEHEVRRLGLTERVTFTGRLDDVASAYQDADVLVYPSSYEVFGMVPLEAILLGTPVIVTSGTGCGEIIGRLGCGSTVPIGDVDALARAIDEVLSDPAGSRRKAEGGRRRIEVELGMQTIAAMFEDVYADCLRVH